MNRGNTSIPKFPNDARVCFVGDSLTACSFWVQFVHEYYLANVPGSQLRVYNGGIGSATIDFMMNYIEENVMVWDPTHVVIMFGANDMMHYHGDDEQRTNAMYNDLKRITDEFIGRGIKVYLATEPNYYHDMELVRNGTLRLAQEYGIEYCDFFTLFDPYMKKHFDEVISDDRIHFSYIGECVIARLFLYSQGFDIDIEDEEKMLERMEMSYFGDRKNIFDRKLRAMWFAEALILIAVIGQPVEAKMKRLMGRIPTRADGAWGDLEFFRAIDYIEIRPNMDLYIQQVEAATELMLAEAAKKAE